MFDVPLPMRRAQRETAVVAEDSGGEGSHTPPPQNTMAFSLMTKKGNRQQTRTIALPSDSNFAVAMKSQQEREREEQQRIKNLVLNYDLRDDTENHDGTSDNFNFHSDIDLLPKKPLNTKGLRLGHERHSASHSSHRSGTNRSGPRARRLQLSDVDWYGEKNKKPGLTSSGTPHQRTRTQG